MSDEEERENLLWDAPPPPWLPTPGEPLFEFVREAIAVDAVRDPLGHFHRADTERARHNNAPRPGSSKTAMPTRGASHVSTVVVIASEHGGQIPCVTGGSGSFASSPRTSTATSGSIQ